MIKSNELRIGNTILYVERIVTIKNAVELHNAIDSSTNILYSPIPITPEILEKCGFDLSLAYRINDFSFEWYEIPKCVTVFYKKVCIEVHVKYLHQLQNLYYSLTNEELEFKP